jgi:signal transduction histidine kinase
VAHDPAGTTVRGGCLHQSAGCLHAGNREGGLLPVGAIGRQDVPMATEVGSALEERDGTGRDARRIRRAKALFVVAVSLVVGEAVAYVLAPPASADWGGTGLASNLPFLLMLLACDVVGLLVILHRPGNAIGWILLALALSWSAGDALSGVSDVAISHGWAWGPYLEAVLQAAWAPPIVLMAVYLVLLFPDGRLPSPRWRPFAWAVGIGTAIGYVGVVLIPGTFADTGHPDVVNPLGVEGSFAALLSFTLIAIPIGMLGAAISLIRRYRRSRGVERQQMKWLAFSAAIVAVVYTVVLPLSVANPDDTPTWLGVLQILSLGTFALIPISIGFAVLRYRLYDIDVVINRAIVFGALAVFIGAVYVAVVVLLGGAIGATTTNPALSIAATAAVAVLFEPARARVQRVANRLVYGERATPYEVLSRFSDRIGGTYATEDVLPRTARILAEGTGAERVDVWLRVGDILQPGASWPADGVPAQAVDLDDGDLPAFAGSAAAVAVREREELLGAVTVKKPAGESMAPAETELLTGLAGQAGLVLSNVRLTAELRSRLDEIARRSDELRASRQRIVTTQDAERRRLERNIHDGAQQHLVALAVKLRLAKGLVAKDTSRAASMLGELRAEVDEAVETLSSLALGIYPPVLEERGIAAALESQARIGATPVTIDADGVDRQPIETEAAVYFCCLEAIQNAAKYAQASRVEVVLGHDAANLTFEIRDDGVGFDAEATARGSGLQGMADRLAALGGSVEVASHPGQGTIVRGRVPAVVFA